MSVQQKYLLWIDCEMTGLDVKTDTLVQIHGIITDNRLRVISEYPGIQYIQHPQSVLDNMCDWCKNTFSENGLLEELKAAKYTMTDVEAMFTTWLDRHQDSDNATWIIAGNSIHQDRVFLNEYMPTLASHLHYRMLDVSSFKIALPRLFDDQHWGFRKKGAHTARADILESIAELRHYRKLLSNR